MVVISFVYQPTMNTQIIHNLQRKPEHHDADYESGIASYLFKPLSDGVMDELTRTINERCKELLNANKR